MARVTIYLRTSLFSVGGPKAHVPAGVVVIEGTVTEDGGGGVTVRCARLLDERGRELAESPITLRLPWAKVDHMVVHEAPTS